MSDNVHIAVTGIGIVSPIGVGRAAFWQALREGRSGITPVEGLARRSGFPRIAAMVGEFGARDLINSAHYRRMDRLSRMAVAAGRLAVDDARLAVEQVAGERVGVVFGTALGNCEESVAHIERVLTRGPAAASPMVFPNLVMNAPAGYIAMEFGCTGLNLTVAQAEVTGEHAIALACDVLDSGRADLVLAGAGDELSPVVVEAYHRTRALAGQRGGREWSSPYDVHRSGLVLGEGAAMLVLEPLERARARSAAVHAVIDGTRSFAVPSPRYDWPVRAVAAQAPLSGLAAGTELICGSANSSRRLDRCELDLFADLLPAGSAHLTSIKGAIGEFGAAGALTAGAACLALGEQTVPPLCHLQTPESDAPLRFAPGRGVATELTHAIVCGVARGGSVVALSMRKS